MIITTLMIVLYKLEILIKQVSLNFIKKKLKKCIKEMSVAQTQNTVVLPGEKTLNQAFKLALKIGKQIDCYFYLDSCAGNV